jgi:hypothetical protein
MKKLIISWKGMLVLFLLLFFTVCIQWMVRDSFKDSTKVWEGTCSFASWVEKDGKVEKMKVKCDDKEGYISDSEIIIAYLRNPVPFPGILYESGKVEIKKPEKK